MLKGHLAPASWYPSFLTSIALHSNLCAATMKPSNVHATLVSAALLFGVVCQSGVSPVAAFSPKVAQVQYYHVPTSARTSTALSATKKKKKKKMSMAEKRKRRGRNLTPHQVERPAVLDRTAPVDQWAPTQTTDESVAQMKEREDAEEAAIQARAAELIASQRKSVDTLTHIRERVESLPYDAIATDLQAKGFYIMDNFLDQNELVSEMEAEAFAVMDSDKLERDLSNLESGEFATRITGGEEQYTDLPRTVEYIVSSTRHMPPLLQEMGDGVLGCSLDATASTGTLRVFDRKARESSLALLSEAPPPREHALANEGNDSDPKKVTVIYFLSDWGSEGGGIGFEDGTIVSPARDRLVIFRSDTCKYRMEPVPAGGEDDSSGNSNFAYIVNQLLRKSTDENQS